SGLESMSEDVVSNESRQTHVEQQFQAVIDETTGKDIVSAPEITASRVGADGVSHANLKQRLDSEQQKVTAQLAQTEKGLSDMRMFRKSLIFGEISIPSWSDSKGITFYRELSGLVKSTFNINKYKNLSFVATYHVHTEV